MHPLQPHRLALLALACALSARADNEGMATQFLGVGYPYGACGVPDQIAAIEGATDTLSGQGNPFDYVALNVYDTPGKYGSPGARPLTGTDTVLLGTYHNGQNCGRWLHLTLGDTCDGSNDGAMNQPFCRGGAGWFPNPYTGGSIDAIVFDQCTDGNAWCRDSKFHLDLHTPILGRLRKDGQLLPPMAVPVLDASGKPKADPNNPYAVEYRVTGFNNPKVSWKFIPAPHYQGEPRFYFSLDAKLYYMRIIVTHLPNGIHGVDQWVNGAWKPAKMEGDAGQLWILPDPSVTTFKLRLYDADDQLVMAGRTWTMDYPKACGTSCPAPATKADNVIGSGGDTTTSGVQFGMPALREILVRGQNLSFPSAVEDQQAVVLSPATGVRRNLSVHAQRATLPELSPGIWVVRWSARDGRTQIGKIILPQASLR